MNDFGPDWLVRSRALLGDEAMVRLNGAHVALFGLGGVGGSCAETLVRAGIGALTLVDMDVFSESNLNRQFLATRSGIDRPKAEVARERFLDINPDCRITAHHAFFNVDSAPTFFAAPFQVVVDAIDGLAAKVSLLKECLDRGLPVVSAVGAGRRLDPTQVTHATLPEVTGDRLASRVRKRLRKDGYFDRIHHIRTVYSTELPWGGRFEAPDDPHYVPERGRSRIPLASFATVPAVAGITAAYLVVDTLLQETQER